MFKSAAYPDTPLDHSKSRDFMRTNLGLSPVQDSLELNGEAATDVTLEAYQTTLVSADAGAQYNLPDGEYVGQRKLLKADVSDAGTCVASDAAKAKLIVNGLHGQSAANVTALTFDADGELALLEWTGAKWNVVYATATVTDDSV
jgi:hypothetical protein